MNWFKAQQRYLPITRTVIVVLRVFLASLLCLYMIVSFNLPAAAILVLMAAVMLNCKEPSFVRHMHWYLPIGFSVGSLFGLLACYWLGNTWSGAIFFSVAWTFLWLYVGELSPLFFIPARIISIIPTILLVMVNAGLASHLTETVLLLFLMSWLGVFIYKLAEVLVFPLDLELPQKQSFTCFVRGFLGSFTFHWRHFIHAIQFVIAILLILSGYHFFDLPGSSSIVTALVSIAVVSSAISVKLRTNIIMRVLGNILGAIWAFACLLFLSHFPFIWLMFAVISLSFGLFVYVNMIKLEWTTIGIQSGYAFVAVNPLSAFSGDMHGAVMRLIGVLLGCVAVFLAHFCVRGFLRD